MPRYEELHLKAGEAILPEWYDKLVDILEQITEAGAVSYGGTMKKDIIPDTDLLLKIGEPGRRILATHAGYGYFSFEVRVGDTVKILPDKIVFPDNSEQTRGADALVTDHEAKTTDVHGITSPDRIAGVADIDSKISDHNTNTGVHGVGTLYIAKTSRSDQYPSWGDIPDKPSTFPPETHADTHKDGGSDEVIGVLKTGTTLPATGQVGQFFLKTDTLEFYYHNGSTWVKVGRLAGLDLDAHASRHKAGGADQLFDQNLNTTDSPTFVNIKATGDIICENYYKTFALRGKQSVYQLEGANKPLIAVNTWFDGSSWNAVATDRYCGVLRFNEWDGLKISWSASLGGTDFVDVFSVDRSGNLNVDGEGLFKGDLKIDRSGVDAPSRLYLNAKSEQFSLIALLEAGVIRWSIYRDVDSNFKIGRYDETGAFIDTPLTINVNTGNVKLYNNLEVSGTANLCQIAVAMRESSTTASTWQLHNHGWFCMPIDLGKFGSSYFRFDEYTHASGQNHGVRLFNLTDTVALAVHETTEEGYGWRTVSIPCTPPSGVKRYKIELHSDGSNAFECYSACLQSGTPLKNLFLVEMEEIEEEITDIDGKMKKQKVKVPKGWSKHKFSYGVHAYDLEKGLMVIQIPDFEDAEKIKGKIRGLGHRMDEITEKELRKYQEEWGYIKIPKPTPIEETGGEVI